MDTSFDVQYCEQQHEFLWQPCDPSYIYSNTWDSYLIWLDELVYMGGVFQTLTLLEEDFGTPSWKGDFDLKEKSNLFPFGSENMSIYSLMDGMKKMHCRE